MRWFDFLNGEVGVFREMFGYRNDDLLRKGLFHKIYLSRVRILIKANAVFL